MERELGREFLEIPGGFIPSSSPKENYEKLKSLVMGWGGSIFGVCDLSKFPSPFHLSIGEVEGLDRGIVIGFRLSKRALAGIVDHPTKLYYHHYRQVNLFLDQLVLRLSGLIQSRGYEALPIPASQVVDWERQSGHLSHRHLAVQAGLGWIGRNNLLVTPEYGAQVRLASTLTNLPLSNDEPLNRGCGGCRKCLPVCPVGAIKERVEEFDHLKCYELLREFQRKGYVGQYICGICVRVCDGPNLRR